MFDSGLCTICTKTETSTNGLMPIETLTPAISNVFYGDRTISYTRMYEARGANSQIDRLIRIPEGKRPEKRVQEILDLSDKCIPLNIIWIGHPAENPDARDQYDEKRIHYIK